MKHVMIYGIVLATFVVCASALLTADLRAVGSDSPGQAATEAKAKELQPSIPTGPTAGEQIKWWVVSGGGGSAASGSYKLSHTIGQTAVGQATSAGNKLNSGFWQSFAPTSCCIGTTGNVNMTGIVDLSDLSSLVNYLTGGGYVLPCVPEANVNNTGIVDLSDLSALVNYLTGGGYVLPNCQ